MGNRSMSEVWFRALRVCTSSVSRSSTRPPQTCCPASAGTRPTSRSVWSFVGLLRSRPWPRARREAGRSGDVLTPLTIEHRVHGLALPLSPEVLVLDEVRFPAHPQFLQDAGRRGVP